MTDCYRPRPIEFRGVRAYPGGWRIKVYTIHAEAPGVPLGSTRLDIAKYEPDLAPGGLIDRTLPRPATEGGRCGAGFLIVHPGRELEYLVLAWWARENELPIRVWVREYGAEGDRIVAETSSATAPIAAMAPGAWRPARGEEANCVWDIQVIAFERDAFVETVYGGAKPGDVEGYLGRVVRTGEE